MPGARVDQWYQVFFNCRQKGYVTVERQSWGNQLFQSIDEKDADNFSAFLADDVLFRFGNAEPVSGKAAVSEAVSGFFGSIRAIEHNVAALWDETSEVICHGTVTYTRHDSTTLSVPFALVLGLDNDLIREYLIFVDVSQLYIGV
jgi:ketosteroid isomerase-like protein